MEALKILISKTVSRIGVRNGGIHKLMFMDVSKAYLHADVIDQDLYVEHYNALHLTL